VEPFSNRNSRTFKRFSCLEPNIGGPGGEHSSGHGVEEISTAIFWISTAAGRGVYRFDRGRMTFVRH